MIVLIVVALALVAAVAAWAALWWRLRSYPIELLHANVRGVDVPVILGAALVAGSLAGIGLLIVIEVVATEILKETLAVVVVTVLMWAAGAWDDRRGDERPRGFRGHLEAARHGLLTGGVLKFFAGGIAGLLAAWLVYGSEPVGIVAETGLLIALSANLVNLFDRAPGRAAKVSLVAAALLVVLGNAAWAASAVPLLGALVFCIGADLRERAMLGDAGANPLGAVLGLGLALSLGEKGRVIALAALFVLNLASEWVSFSRIIERVAPLRWFDGLGRKDHVASK